ncbi:MAG: hypothetical protein LBM61_04855 [Prevotellaceae bacterium]|jgi:hypothetical protein|nr:hypothetical protein [Prevotellaceae bacterium]
MEQKIKLPHSFNMSLGFIPVVITLLLSEFTTIDTAIITGTAISLTASVLLAIFGRIPAVTLNVCTGVLLFCCLLAVTDAASLLYGIVSMPEWSPFLLEVAILVPMLTCYQFKDRILRACRERMVRHNRKADSISKWIQAWEATFIAIRVLLLFALIHVVLILWGVFSIAPVKETGRYVLFHVLPPLVFICAMLFNQYGLNYFNRLMAHTRYIAVVDDNGHVKGKIPEVEAIDYKNAYTNAVVRIIPLYDQMIFVSKRDENNPLDAGKMDTPLESFVRYGEKIEDTVNRLLGHEFPEISGMKPRFVVKHILKNSDTSRVIYMFTLDMPEEEMLCNVRFVEGKLWSVTQMEQNLQANYFGTTLEEEFGLLKDIIDTREKYKVS